MVKSSMCRICLVEDIRMHCIHNTNLQETYERLTGLPFVTIDSRPLQLCYICCARLRNCYKLQSTCLESEELFTEMLEQNKLKPTGQDSILLKVHPVINWSNVTVSPEDVPVDIIIDDDDDDDDVIFCDNNHNVDVSVDIKVETMEDNIEHSSMKYTGPKDIPDIDTGTLKDNIEQAPKTKEIGNNNSLVVDINTVDNTTNTESSNNSILDISSGKPNIIEKTDRTGQVGSNNTRKFNINTTKENVEPKTNVKPIDTITIDVSMVKGGVIQEIVNIDYTESINISELDVNMARDDVTQQESSIEHTESNVSPILSVNTVKDDDTNKRLVSVKDLNVSREDVSLKHNSIEHEMHIIHTDPVYENIKEVVCKHTQLKDTNTLSTLEINDNNKKSAINNINANDIPKICDTQQESSIEHNESNVSPILSVNTVKDDTNKRLVSVEDLNVSREVSLKHNSIEHEMHIIHTDPVYENIKEVVCKHTQLKDTNKLNISTLEVNDINKKSAINNINANDTSKICDFYAVNDHIVEQEIVIENTESKDSPIFNNTTLENNMVYQDFDNEYAVPNDIFSCDDINAVEGNFIGQEVVIGDTESTEILDYGNIITDTNIINQENSNNYVSNYIPKLADIAVNDSIITQETNTSCTVQNHTPIFDKINSIEHTSEEITIEYTEIKNIPKLDDANTKDDMRNQDIAVEFTESNYTDYAENYDEKGNLSDKNEIDAEDDIEEKYNIENESVDITDNINDKRCLQLDTSKDIFRQDVMVVLPKTGLDCNKTNEDQNFEGENIESRSKDHRRRRSTRKRKSAVLRETLQTANTKKRNKKVRFSHIKDKEGADNQNCRKNIERKPFICDICHKSFILKHHLIEHNRKHTGEKPYKCDICEQRFYYQSVLSYHAVTHSDSRPHKCNICGKCYGLKVNLMRHIRVHTCEKPYKCHICGKSFVYKHHLTTHIRIHTGERPFPCHLCPKRFNQRNNLNTHLRSMHPDAIPHS